MKTLTIISVQCWKWLAVLLLALGLANSVNAKPEKNKGPVQVQAEFTGQGTAQPVGNNLLIVVAGPGHSPQFGDVTAVSSWFVDLGNGNQLLMGDVDMLPVNVGSLTAKLPNGDTLVGSFSGTVKRINDHLVAIETTFRVFEGTGSLKGVTGQGRGTGTLDLHTAQYAGTINGVLKFKGKEDKKDD